MQNNKKGTTMQMLALTLCEDCIDNKMCTKRDNCEYIREFIHGNYQTVAGETLRLREKYELNPYPFRKLPYNCRERSRHNNNTEIIPSIYSYHRSVVNDALKTIRSCRVAFVNTQQVLIDIIKCQKDVDIIQLDWGYYIFLKPSPEGRPAVV